MDYKSTLIKTLFLLFIPVFIVGCDTEISPEPLRIIGNPTDEMYYGANYEFEFGVSGGDGVYQYTYIQNPEPEDENDGSLAENNIDMTIQVTDDAKASFKLIAKPVLPDDADIAQVNNQKLKYGIKVTDGNYETIETYEFTLKKNKLSIENVEIAQESTAKFNIADSLLDLKNGGDDRVCDQIYDRNFVVGETDGQTVYPFVFQVLTEALVTERTEFYYELRTNYSESAPEMSATNVGSMRKNVDFLDKERKIVLEPGEASCVGFIEFLDDATIEDTESVTITFTDVVGGPVDVTSAREVVELRDNEPTPRYETDKIVRNRGQSAVIPISISRPVTYPVSINFSVDADETTATLEDYAIEPQSRVITFQPGQTDAAITLNLLQKDADSAGSAEDKLITLITDVDELVEVEPYEIRINDWATQSNTQEIIASSVSDEEVIDFAVELDGFITTLIQTNTATNISTTLRSFDQSSNPSNFVTSGDLELSKIGVDVVPRAIEAYGSGSAFLAVVLNVNGLYADVSRGGEDFVVMMFEKLEDNTYSLTSAKQYGTEGDDVVEGAVIKGSNLYVYGMTNGQDFEGQASDDTNNGGSDGFVYTLDSTNNNVRWARFVGTSDTDKVVSVDASNRDVVSLGSTTSSDEDAFLELFEISGDVDDEALDFSFSSVRDETPVSILFDSSASNFNILIDSNANIDESNTPTPSLTRDAQLKSINSEGESIGYLSFATSKDDIAKSLVKTSDNAHLIVSGDTFGRFEDNTKVGTGDSDVFVSIVDSEKVSSLEIKKTIQFGTPEDDSLIKVRAASETKFFALWKEQYSSTGNTVYRISAFSVDGEKLSSDPQ